MARDHVCGMSIDEKKAEATFEYGGELYYFCAAECKDKFAEVPRQVHQIKGRVDFSFPKLNSIYGRRKRRGSMIASPLLFLLTNPSWPAEKMKVK